MPRRSTISSRTLIAAVASVAILPLGVLLWAAWQLRQQDRVLSAQQASQGLERAADIVVAALQSAISASRQQLAAGARAWPEGAASILITPSHFETWPRGRLAWVPEPPNLAQAPSSATAEGEDLEFKRGDAKAAEALYRTLAAAPEPDRRAAASIRLARVLRAQGRHSEAMEVYRSMDSLDDAAIEQIPASLLALHAGVELLAELGSDRESRASAVKLQAGLRSGRWPLTQPLYQTYATEPAEASRVALSAAAAQLVQKWKRSAPEGSGSAFLHIAGTPVAVIYQAAGGSEIRALMATESFAEAQWLPRARQAASAQGVGLALLYSESAKPGQAAILRRAADIGLPWSVAIASLNPAAELAQFGRRQRIFEGALLLLAVFTLAAAAVTVRAILRETETARLQSEFVAAVSHEFRTPLTSLRQFTEMLRDGRPLSDARRQTCYAAQSRATDRLGRLVESILAFDRMERGVHGFRMESCESEPLVRRIVDDFATAGAAGVQVELDCRASPRIEADPEAVGRAVWNLLDNAVKYSPGQSRIEISLDRRPGHAAIAVRDFGVGIPRHEHEAIFRRFRRGAQAVELGIKGTGIGLALVDHIVRAHRGRVDVESQPGQGSCFTILLPIRE